MRRLSHVTATARPSWVFLMPVAGQELVRSVKLSRERLTTHQLENIALLRGKQLDLTEGQVLAALAIIAENDIPLESSIVKLVEIAERFK